MINISFQNKSLLTVCLFLLCIPVIIFNLNIKAAFSYYGPVFQNPLLGPISPIYGYLGTTFIPSNSSTYSQNFSYNDYYSAYPYLQIQNQTGSSSTNGTVTNTTNTTNNTVVNNAVRYLPTSSSYISGYLSQIYNSGVYNPYSTYQSQSTYQSTNYPSLSSNIYQTVQTYPNNNNTNTQSQTSSSQTGTYGQSNTSTGTYIPAGQTGYYAPTQSQTYTNYSPYQTSNYQQSSTYSQYQPTVYVPSNSYTTNQTITNGYYNPNSNYWPTSGISTSTKATVKINGEYRGEWSSDTTSVVGQICFAEIDQFDTQIEGEIKLKEFTIGTSGKTNITGTVNGNMVSLEINLGGSVLIFEGTAQSNGMIVGNYTVEGSSGSTLDEGSLTLQYR
ncbi:MAG: hypothetical protein ACMUIU_04745 [bacterium]